MFPRVQNCDWYTPRVTEQLPYTVLHNYGDFEVRRYPDHVQVRVTDQGDFTSVGYRAFGPLFQFISGNNSESRSIAMTAPVLQEEVAANTHVVSFVMPSEMAAWSVPAPTDARVETAHIAGFDAAVLSFRGSWRVDRLHAKGAELQRAAAREGLNTTGNVLYARFNPPWMPPFLKHNEALIALATPFA